MALPLFGLLAGAGTIMQGLAQFKQGQQQAQNIKYNRSTSQANERIRQASFRFEQDRIRDEKERFTSTQTALYAKAGVRFEGSPVTTIKNTIREFELDIFASEFNSLASLYSTRMQDRLMEAEMRDAKTAGTFGALTSTAIGLGTIGMQYKGK